MVNNQCVPKNGKYSDKTGKLVIFMGMISKFLLMLDKCLQDSNVGKEAMPVLP
jgi:hypothetical protein